MEKMVLQKEKPVNQRPNRHRDMAKDDDWILSNQEEILKTKDESQKP